jgi:hypothetical protein
LRPTLAIIGLFVLLALGCPKPMRPNAVPEFNAPIAVELDNTRWWLRFHEGQKDERLLEFKRVGDGYVCTLTNPGKLLVLFKYTKGERYCEVKRVGGTRYEGTLRKRFPDGGVKDVPISFETYGLLMRWSESGNDRWERLP